MLKYLLVMEYVTAKTKKKKNTIPHHKTLDTTGGDRQYKVMDIVSKKIEMSSPDFDQIKSKHRNIKIKPCAILNIV